MLTRRAITSLTLLVAALVSAPLVATSLAPAPLEGQGASGTRPAAPAAPADSIGIAHDRRVALFARGVNVDQELRIAAFELANGQTIAALDRLDGLRRGGAADSTAPLPQAQRVQLLYLRSQVYARLGMGEELRTAGAAMLALSDTGAAATMVRGELMLDAYRRGDDAEVQALAGATADAAPTGAPALSTFIVGLARYRAGDLASARTSFAAVRGGGGVYAGRAAFMDALARARADSAQAQEALAAIRLLADSAGGAVRDEARLAAAQLAFQAGQYDSAAALASAVDSGGAVAVQASHTRAWALYRGRRVEAAQAAFAAFARRYPDLPGRDEARVMAGQVLLEAGHPDAAEAYFDTLADSLHHDVARLQARRPELLGDAARRLVEQRAAGILFAQDPQTGRAVVLSSQPFGAGAELLVPFDDAPAPRWPTPAPPQSLSFGDMEQRLDSLGLGLPGALPRRVLFADAVSQASTSAYVTRAQALRSAEVNVAVARYRLEQEQRMRAARVAMMERLNGLLAQRDSGLSVTAARVAAVQDSLARVLTALDTTRARMHAYLSEQATAARQVADRNAAVADSITRALAGILRPEEAQAIALEAAAAREYRAAADEIERNPATAIGHQPVFALHDSVAARLNRSRALLADTRSAIASTAQIAANERAALEAEEDAATREARSALDATEARRAAAASDLVALVQAELAARADRLVATLQRDAEAAEFGSASALFFKTIAPAAAAASPDASRETAIARLQGFLARYPDSRLRPSALFELGELLVRRADARFAEAQRAAGAGRANVPERPDYSEAIARYEELIRGYPDFDQIAAAAYTLGTLEYASARYAEAGQMFEIVAQHPESSFRAEALFRLGDTRFEQASEVRGDARRQRFADAASAYQRAVAAAPAGGDIYFLSLYKLGWAYYSQATRDNPGAYAQAVDVFGRLVTEYDQLSPGEQARLGLRGEAIDYMAVAFTQIGGAEAANQYFASRNTPALKLTVLRRLAASLRDQGELDRAVAGYQAVIASAPTDSGALAAQQEIIDIYQNRLLDPAQAQRARLDLVESYGPESAWAAANPALVPQANRVREEALRQSAQYALAGAQKARTAQRYSDAAALYERYMQSFASFDSARAANFLFGEALFGEHAYAAAGAQYARTAYGYPGDSPLAPQAAQNAIVAYDSAWAHAPNDRAVQDSFFTVVDRYVAAYSGRDVARKALIEKGRRASQAARWDVMEATFRTYAERYPNDAYTPTAQKLVGDALFRQDKYAEAQAQWETAQQTAAQSGKRALSDSIGALRTAAASSFADTLVKRGEYRRAAEDVYVAFAERNPQSARAPDALRDAIETYLLADSVARGRGDSAASRDARTRAVELAQRLVTTYPDYRYRLQYESLSAQLLADLGRRDEAVQAWQRLIEAQPSWPGRADAMVRVAVMLDSLGRGSDAADAYARFAAAYPKDPRAADAEYNAAVTYLAAGDTAAATRAYGAFAQQFPRDARAAQAQQARLALLRAAGDSTALETELARLCASPSPALRGTCAARTGQREFRAGAELFPRYQAMQLVLSTRAQLTRAGVERASARKRALLRQMTAHFTKAIESGVPEWLSAATYYVGLAQWDYGNFLRNATLPADLTDAQREAAERGAEQQAAGFDQAAHAAWQSLVDKAQQGGFDNAWVQAARSALAGNVVVPTNGEPPPAAPPAAPDSTPAPAPAGPRRPPPNTTRGGA